jgi:drug/metabolite transporter (DMT)-like permease
VARPADLALVAYLGVFQIGIAYVLVLRALRRVSALEAALLLMVEPVLNPLWAWLLHGEEPGALALLGGAIILGATLWKTVVDARNESVV